MACIILLRNLGERYMALQICVEGVGVIEGAEICTLENMSVPWRPLQRGLLYSKVLRMN